MILYDPDSHVFTGIDPAWLVRCRDAYPHVKIEQALKQAALWLDADWPKRKKVRWERFLTNWFAKAERDALIKDRTTKTQPGLRPPIKRVPIEELVPKAEIREFITKLAEMKVVPSPQKKT